MTLDQTAVCIDSIISYFNIHFCKGDFNTKLTKLILFSNTYGTGKKNFSWKLGACMGSQSLVNGSGKYYPDWEGSNERCIVDSADSLAPGYMQENPTVWMLDTLDACCTKYYKWNRAKCVGSSSRVGSNKCYIDYVEEKCVKDCVKETGCGGLAESWDQLYESQSDCCKAKNWWNSHCDL